jgi:hypothetical protein
MRAALFTALTLACLPSVTTACELAEQPAGWRDEPIRVGADCSYENAGHTFYNDVTGSAAVKVGNGLIAYEVTQLSNCGYSEHLVVVDCNSGEMIGIEGKAWENGTFGGTRASLLYPPKGAVRLNAKTTIDGLVTLAERKGYTYWLDVEARLAALKKKNRPNPNCGCKLFYPDSAGAQE